MMIASTMNGIAVTANKDVPKTEIDEYIKIARERGQGQTLIAIDLNFIDEDVQISASYKPVPFERIRRITGYLVGTLDRFNDAKAAEEKDRVKHI